MATSVHSRDRSLFKWIIPRNRTKLASVCKFILGVRKDHLLKVTMSSQVSHSQSVLPIFMGKSRNITFILDSSLGMNGFLGPVKNLIIQTLITKASLRDSLFNIISFSYKATPWSSHMMPCTPDVVYEALSWIHTLQTSPGRDLYAALALAFSDPACQSVHLVTTGLPDNPTQCLSSSSTLVTRPVHTFYISDKTPMNTGISDFLQCISSTTRGSCYVMSLNSAGDVDQLSLLHSTGDHLIQNPSYSEDQRHSVDSCQVPYFNCTNCVCSAPYWCSPMNPFSAVSCVSGRVMRGAELFRGCRVLARKQIDGFYYLGTIIHQGRGNLYMVEFDKFGPKGNTFKETLNIVQPTCQPDIVNLAIAHGQSIVPGDTILAPWEPDLRRYGPGRVVSGMALRYPLQSEEGLFGLQVLFWNGMTVHVPKELAVQIPASHHEQIIKDLQHYSSRPCCYRVSHCCTMNCFESPCHQCNHHSLPSIPLLPCPVKRCWPMFMSSPRLNYQRDELERKVDLQLKELQSSRRTQESSSSSDSDEYEEDTAAEKHGPSGSELVSRSVNTEISCLRKPYTQPESRPAWRYWKSGSAEPQHKQPGRAVRSPNVTHSWPRDTGNSGSSTDNSMITNHSSLFKLVRESPKRGVNMRDIFGSTQSHHHHNYLQQSAQSQIK